MKRRRCFLRQPVGGRIEAQLRRENAPEPFHGMAGFPLIFRFCRHYFCGAMATFDTLPLARVLRDQAGFSQDAAEATAAALGAALGGTVATKADLDAGLAPVKTDVATLKVDVATLKADVAALKTDVATLKTDVAEIKGSIRLLRWQIAVSWALSVAILVKLFVH